MKSDGKCCRSAFTLLELIVVVVILTAVAGIVVMRSGSLSIQAAEGEVSAEELVTRRALQQIQDAIMGLESSGYWQDHAHEPSILGRYPRLDVDSPPSLAYLFIAPPGAVVFDPTSETGWRGPYLQSYGTYPEPGKTGRWDAAASVRGFDATYGAPGDPAVLDGWFNPIVIQEPSQAGLSEEVISLNTRLISAGPNGRIDTDAADTTPGEVITGDDIVLFLRTAE